MRKLNISAQIKKDFYAGVILKYIRNGTLGPNCGVTRTEIHLKFRYLPSKDKDRIFSILDNLVATKTVFVSMKRREGIHFGRPACIYSTKNNRLKKEEKFIDR